MSDDRRQVGRFKQLDLGGRIPEQERLCDDQYIQVPESPNALTIKIFNSSKTLEPLDG